MIGLFGRQGPAATLRQHCPQMTQRRCNCPNQGQKSNPNRCLLTAASFINPVPVIPTCPSPPSPLSASSSPPPSSHSSSSFSSFRSGPAAGSPGRPSRPFSRPPRWKTIHLMENRKRPAPLLREVLKRHILNVHVNYDLQ